MDRLNLCIFGDESSQTKHRYLVLGTTICRDEECGDAEERLRNAIRAYPISEEDPQTSELKWEKVKARTLIVYRAVLQTYFDLIKEGVLDFYGLIVDTHQLDNKRFNGGDSEIGFNKLFFSLLFKPARHFKKLEPRFYAYLDHRNTRHPLEPIRDMLNRRAARDCGLDYNPYRVLQFRKSHTELLIQLTDIVAGAVAYEMNGHHLKPNAAHHKIAAMKFVAEMAGVKTLARPTPFNGPEGFDLWHYDLSKTKRVSHA